MNIGRTGKYYYLRFLRLRGNPHSLALGAAIGVFIGITPTVPLHTLAILALTLLTRSSFLAGLITSWLVCNPLTYIPQYYLSLKIGNFVTSYHLDWERIRVMLDLLLSDASFSMRLKSMLSLGYETSIVLLAGGLIMAIPLGIASYYASYFLIIKFREKRSEKRILH